MKISTATKKLNSYKKEASMLEMAVIDILINNLEGYDKVEDLFNDIASHGCINGTIPELIYYSDTHTFFDDNVDEILELVNDYQHETGANLEIKGDIRNYYAWFAFEETARRLAWNVLGIEN